jgi:hypothetical protein
MEMTLVATVGEAVVVVATGREEEILLAKGCWRIYYTSVLRWRMLPPISTLWKRVRS